MNKTISKLFLTFGIKEDHEDFLGEADLILAPFQIVLVRSFVISLHDVFDDNFH